MRVKLNEHFAAMKPSYLFSDIARRVAAYRGSHPDADIIRLGIGDVTLPLPSVVVSAMEKATREMGVAETFRGYPPEEGYAFLREAIARHYASFGVEVSADEIFVSDGAKSDVGNITDLFGDNLIRIPDPVYPVYMDSNLMCGRHIELMLGNEENGFLPMPDGLSDTPSIIYLCSPNNPTGAVYSHEQLAEWVAYANRTGSLIIYDAAYEAFIGNGMPRSIFTVEGARTCALEICSFSKTAGFTGVRCSFTTVPKELIGEGGESLRAMWSRRQATKFNGVPYIVQRGAEAALTDEGMAACLENIAYYMENARILADLLTRKGITFFGGVSSPYLWLKCPGGMDSWQFFDYLLEKVQVVGTPGAGFGAGGEGYFRLTSFGSRKSTVEAVARLEKLL